MGVLLFSCLAGWCERDGWMDGIYRAVHVWVTRWVIGLRTDLGSCSEIVD